MGDQFQWRCCFKTSRKECEPTGYTSYRWESDDFHRLCDGVAPTVVLLRVKNFIFGGYTDKDWAGKILCNVHMCGKLTRNL